MSRFFDSPWSVLLDDDFSIFRSERSNQFSRLDQLWNQARTMIVPRVAWYDAGSELVLRAELPGFGQDNVNVTAEDGMITISGARTPAAPDGYVARRQERLPMKFSRSFALPEGADVDQAHAVMADGMLTLHIPKLQKAQPRQIPIKPA